MRHLILFLLSAAICTCMLGCGETIAGVGKDVNRMGRGTNTFFFRQP